VVEDITEAADAERSLESERERLAITTDLTVPGGMGGAELARAIRELDGEVPMIVMSGYMDLPVLEKFEEHGFAARLSKPLDATELNRALCRALPEYAN